MSLTLRTDYWDDPLATRAFQDFMVDTFRLDFGPWRELGYWDPDYRPFSYFSGSRVVSNVCVYSLPMVVQGRPVRAAQISAVGTVPAYRRRGLNQELTQRAEDWARPQHRFCFLFADDDAVPFYRKLGFEPVPESQPVLPVRGARPRPGLCRLDLGRREHLSLIHDLAQSRTPVSSELGVLSSKLLMFHVLLPLRGHAYHDPELGVVVLLKREADRVTIYDVVGPSVPEFRALYPYLAAETDREVVFAFWPDRLQIREEVHLRELKSNNLHVKGEIDLSRPVLFPFTSHA